MTETEIKLDNALVKLALDTIDMAIAACELVDESNGSARDCADRLCRIRGLVVLGAIARAQEEAQ